MYFKGRGIPMTVADVLNSEGGRPLTPEIDEVEWGCNHGRRQGQEVGRERVVIGDQRIIRKPASKTTVKQSALRTEEVKANVVKELSTMSTNNSTQSPQSNVVELSVTIASKKEQRHYVGHEVVIFQRVEGKMVRLSEASKGGDSDMVIVQKTQEKASYQPLKLPLNKTFINRQGELFVEAFEFSQNNYGQVLVGNGGTPQCFEEKVDEGSARFFLSFGKERTLFTISYNGFAKEHRIVRHRIKVSKDGLTVNLQSEQVHYTKEGEIRKGFESLQAAFDAVEEKVESKKQGLFFVAKPAGEISLPTQEQVAA